MTTSPWRSRVAWDVYCIGRLVRLGFKHYDNRQRWLYHFRNRHGFTDAADDAFERLWTGDDLTWADITALSRRRRRRLRAASSRRRSATARVRWLVRSWALIVSSRSISAGG